LTAAGVHVESVTRNCNLELGGLPGAAEFWLAEVAVPQKPIFQIEISGENVIPETTRASDLAEVVLRIEKAVVDTAIADGIQIPDEAVVSLVGIEEGSNRLTLAAAVLVLPVVGRLSQAVYSNNYGQVPRPAHEALYEVSRRAVERHWTVHFIPDPSAHIQPATISEQCQIPPPPALPEVMGTTTIYGRCVRVGGVRPRAEIALLQGGTLFIDVSEQMARDLGRRLYDEVCIRGEVTWEAERWSVQSFRATEVMEYGPVGLESAFQQLATAAGTRWDGVDVVEYVQQVRHGGQST
jgi:hypothetical protein